MDALDETQEILKAAEQGKWEAVKQLVSDNPKLAAARDATGVSLLMMLAYRGANDAAAFVARHTALDVFEATVMGDCNRLTEILAATPDAVAAVSADGWTPLHLAGFFGRAESAKLLLAHGASVSAYGNNYMRNMPLHAALAGSQDAALVRLLLEHDADVNAKGATNITPLHLAASRGNQALVDMLLAKGADKAAKMDNGMNASDLARDRNFPQVADALM
jgi:ankyrin repeat protein